MRIARTILLTSTIIAGLAAATASFAQTPPTTDQPATSAPGQSPGEAEAQKHDQQGAAPTAVGELIVTGSRIKRSTFTSPSPITVITSEQSELIGEIDTSQILQLSTVANNSAQINNFFTGFLTTGGPGVNTLSLRGLGAQRTLFLLNGQRMGPAGVGGTVGPVDLNTIPASMIDHIEILKDGASSIYGSDAIAGVVNVITKTNLDGGDIHVEVNPTQHGGGNQYQANGSWGKTFDRGYITLGFDYYRQDPLYIRQRASLACGQSLAIDEFSGAPADLIDPTTGKDKCNNVLLGLVDLGLGFQEYAPNPSAQLGALLGGTAPGGVCGIDQPGWQAVGFGITNPTIGCTLTQAQARLSQAQVPEDGALFGDNTAISPVSRYTITGFGGYDLDAHNHLYSSILLNRRDSSQELIDQFFVEVVNPGNPFNPGFFYPVPILLQAAPATQRVDYGRFVLGIKGDIPSFGIFKNWTYDIYGQYSRSNGSYTQEYIKTDRVNATAGAGAGTNGCDVNAIYGAVFGETAGPGNETMAMAEPGVPCVPVNYFAAALNGHFTPAEAAFLYTNETGHTIYDHAYVEGSATGDLFNLPAGPLGAAVGFQLRHEDIDDVPGQDFINRNVYGFSTTGITKGYDDIEEAFGELEIPVLKNLPAIDSLNFNVSGRFSHYRSYGSNGTWKATMNWKVNDWFTIRATHGTAFRAPALYELFLADQIGFEGQISIDPCINYGTSGVSQTIQKNCASQGIPANYNGAGASAEVLTGGGGVGHLKPETSVANTAGFVFTPKWFGLDLSVAADYFTYNIANQIQQFGAAAIVTQCYDSTNFPTNPFCSLFNRNGPGGNSPFVITTVQDNYVNVARQIEQGLDLDIQFKTNLPGDVKLTILSQNSWSFYTNTILLNGQTSNLLGAIGLPVYNGNLNFRFDRGPWTINYYLYMVGHSSDQKLESSIDPNFFNTGESVFLNHVVTFYSTSNISIRRTFHDFSVEAGVKNLFDKGPPQISSEDNLQGRIGNFPNNSQYTDGVYGRSFFVTLDKKF